MNKLKILFQNTIAISAGILIVMSAEGCFYHVLGDDMVLQWYHPITVLLAGFLCSLPTLFLVEYQKLSAKSFLIRVALHCLSLYVMVMIMGYLFGWYRSTVGFVLQSLSYVFVYGFVWISSIWLAKKDEREINAALKEIQDEE